jgi:hypothetical protein
LRAPDVLLRHNAIEAFLPKSQFLLMPLDLSCDHGTLSEIVMSVFLALLPTAVAINDWYEILLDFRSRQKRGMLA